MAERFLIWGGGGHGKVVADLIRTAGGEVAGFIDRDAAKVGKVVEPGGATVLHEEEAFVRLVTGRADAADHRFALGIGDNRLRLAVMERVGPERFSALVHPTATLSPSCSVEAGAVVFAKAVVNAASAIGAGAIVNSGAIVEHDCEIGPGAHVSPAAVLTGGVRVGRRAWIGAGAVVLPGLRIGADALVGAGAVVTRDVPDGVKVVGNPAHVMGAVHA